MQHLSVMEPPRDICSILRTEYSSRHPDGVTLLPLMYEILYGLSCEPFSVAADPRFFWLSPKHRQARAHLRHGMRRGAGFLLLSGEIGAGKTTVCRHFLRELPQTVDVAFIVNPRLDAQSLLTRICEDLRISVPPGTVDMIDLIQGHLLLAHAQGRRTLIVVDEAQALSFDVLEQLRLLTNLDATGSKLQVFLIGQPELRTLLRDPVLAPVAQRIVGRFHLSALEESQTATYIAHRLRVAGLNGPIPFDERALQAIHRLSRGIPRSINVLCDQSLVAADADVTWAINEQMIERIASEVFDTHSVAEPAQVSIAPPSPSSALAEESARGERESGGALWPRHAMIAVASLVLGAILAELFLPKPLPPTSKADGGTDAVAATAAPPATALAPPATTLPPSGPIEPSLAVQDGPGEALRTNIETVFAAADTDEARAWRRLGLLWDTTLGIANPCGAAERLGLRCYNVNGGLAAVRQLNRPGLLKVTDGERVAYIMLMGLTEDTATFSSDALRAVPTSSLARHWHGEFATLWRVPPGYRSTEPTDAAFQSWMRRQLSTLDGKQSKADDDSDLPARIAALQLSHGLKPDGVAGPLTLMLINRAVGVDEPTLSAGRR